jgi:hypothetical protein
MTLNAQLRHERGAGQALKKAHLLRCALSPRSNVLASTPKPVLSQAEGTIFRAPRN